MSNINFYQFKQKMIDAKVKAFDTMLEYLEEEKKKGRRFEWSCRFNLIKKDRINGQEVAKLHFQLEHDSIGLEVATCLGNAESDILIDLFPDNDRVMRRRSFRALLLHYENMKSAEMNVFFDSCMVIRRLDDFGRITGYDFVNFDGQVVEIDINRLLARSGSAIFPLKSIEVPPERLKQLQPTG